MAYWIGFDVSENSLRIHRYGLLTYVAGVNAPWFTLRYTVKGMSRVGITSALEDAERRNRGRRGAPMGSWGKKVGLRLAEESQEWLDIPVVWEGLEDVPIVLANNALGQVGHQDEIILSFGQLTPPAIYGDLERQREQAQQIERLAVKPVARVGLTRAGLDDLIRILSGTRDNYDRMQEARARRIQGGDET
jgi:hypothetical protein